MGRSGPFTQGDMAASDVPLSVLLHSFSLWHYNVLSTLVGLVQLCSSELGVILTAVFLMGSRHGAGGCFIQGIAGGGD